MPQERAAVIGQSASQKTAATFGKEARNSPCEFSERDLEHLQQRGHLWRRCVYSQEFAEMFLIHGEHVQQSRWKLMLLFGEEAGSGPKAVYLHKTTGALTKLPQEHWGLSSFKTLIQYSFEMLRRASRGEAGHFLMFEAIQDSRYCSFCCTACISNSFSVIHLKMWFSGFNLWLTFVFLFSFIDCNNFLSHHSSSFLPPAAFQTKCNQNVSKLVHWHRHKFKVDISRIIFLKYCVDNW